MVLQSVGLLRTGAEAHVERVHRRLERVLVGFRLNGVRPVWLDAYVAEKQVGNVSEGTLLRYLEDLQCFAHDPAGMSLPEIKTRLGFWRGLWRSRVTGGS